MSKIYIDSQKFGKLKIKIPQEVSYNSHKKVLWMCDCGRETYAQICKVMSSHSKSCGKCNEISAEDISKMKFGRLRVKNPQSIKPGSGKRYYVYVIVVMNR